MNPYIAEIEGWDWSGIKKDAERSLYWDKYEPHNVIGRSWLGTVFALTPSGKFYTPFACSNVTEEEAQKDEEWQEALEEVAESHGMFIDWDGEDIRAAICLDPEEIDDTKHAFEEQSNYDAFTTYCSERDR